MKLFATVAVLGTFAILSAQTVGAASVKPGDLITPQNASAVADLVSPGNLELVKQGMRMNIVPTAHLEWPPSYKTATEKYAPQVRLNDKGELDNYVAGLPFPLLDPNDPLVATKVMWNFSFRPQYTDDVDIRDVEVESYRANSAFPGPIEHFSIGHFAFYNNMGRTEVRPIPTDPEATGAGIRYRFGAFPFLEPAEIEGFGLIRERSKDPNVDDYCWFWNVGARAPRRVRAEELSDAIALFQVRSRTVLPPMQTISIPIPISAFRRKSRTTLISFLAYGRCSQAFTRSTHRPSRVSSTTTAAYARRPGRCANSM